VTDANDRELVIRDLRVAPAASPDHEILQGIDLTIRKGETHAIMGPNGSGKTTLAYALMGHPAYVIKSGEVRWKGYDLLKLSPDKRSRLGLFLAFQYPTAIPASTRTPRSTPRTRCAAGSRCSSSGARCARRWRS
jgi:Fe-S cluster assembly ATP-binding protein